jgi:hypothetical protein
MGNECTPGAISTPVKAPTLFGSHLNLHLAPLACWRTAQNGPVGTNFWGPGTVLTVSNIVYNTLINFTYHNAIVLPPLGMSTIFFV